MLDDAKSMVKMDESGTSPVDVSMISYTIGKQGSVGVETEAVTMESAQYIIVTEFPIV